MNIMKWREGREPAEPRGIVLRDTVRYTAIVDGWERAWEVYIPKAYTGEKKVPAIFCVHGAGGFSTAKTAWPLIAEREHTSGLSRSERTMALEYLGSKNKRWRSG